MKSQFDEDSRENDLSIDLKSNEISKPSIDKTKSSKTISKSSKYEISKKFNEVYDDKNELDDVDENGNDVLTSFGRK